MVSAAWTAGVHKATAKAAQITSLNLPFIFEFIQRMAIAALFFYRFILHQFCAVS